jgi:DNA modification methylase
MEINKVYVADALEGLRSLPDESVQCCVTSPPYYKLRDYGISGQIGQEKSPEEYVDRLVRIFSALKKKLKSNGTLWCNLADSYAGSGKAGNNPEYRAKHWMFGKTGWDDSMLGRPTGIPSGCKAKDLIGIPWMVAFALRTDGWFLRQDIIWAKPNPMPESVTDRCTKSHEYIFLLSKSSSYYFDQAAIKQPLKKSSVERMSQNIEHQAGSYRVPGKTNGPMKVKSVLSGKKHKNLLMPGGKTHSFHQARSGQNAEWFSANVMANRRSVWTIATQPSKEAHFAMFPLELPTLCIKAGSSHGDLVIDPFCGGGTALLAASILGRKYIGFDLNPKYVAIAQKRLRLLEGLFYTGP